MVVLSRFRLMSSRWVKPGQAETRYQQSGQKWIDSLRVNCTGGHGGNGLPGALTVVEIDIDALI